jgi:hypothetical protein
VEELPSWSSSWVRAEPRRRPPPHYVPCHRPPPCVPQATPTRSAAPAQEKEKEKRRHAQEKENGKGAYRTQASMRAPSQADASWLLLCAPDTRTPRHRPVAGADLPWTHASHRPMLTNCSTRTGTSPSLTSISLDAAFFNSLSLQPQ